MGTLASNEDFIRIKLGSSYMHERLLRNALLYKIVSAKFLEIPVHSQLMQSATYVEFKEYKLGGV